MGGFSIMFLFFLWPLLLAAQLLALLNMALSTIAAVLLVWNGLVTLFLLWLRRRQRIRAFLDRAYIETQTGWRRGLLLFLRYGWVVLVLWEALLTLACAVVLLRPGAWFF